MCPIVGARYVWSGRGDWCFLITPRARALVSVACGIFVPHTQGIGESAAVSDILVTHSALCDTRMSNTADVREC